MSAVASMYGVPELAKRLIYFSPLADEQNLDGYNVIMKQIHLWLAGVVVPCSCLTVLCVCVTCSLLGAVCNHGGPPLHVVRYLHAPGLPWLLFRLSQAAL